MDCFNDIILKKETEAARESLECSVEIKQELEDPLSVTIDDPQPMQVLDDDDAAVLKAENSDDSRPLKSRGKKSDKLLKLKKSRAFERKTPARVRKRRQPLVIASAKHGRDYFVRLLSIIE